MRNIDPKMLDIIIEPEVKIKTLKIVQLNIKMQLR